MKFKVITLSGSTKFKKEFRMVEKKLTLEGNIVISLGSFDQADGEKLSDETFEMLVEMHNQKIDMADEIFIINKGGYIGKHTTDEINYARSKGKTIRYLEPLKEVREMRLYELFNSVDKETLLKKMNIEKSESAMNYFNVAIENIKKIIEKKNYSSDEALILTVYKEANYTLNDDGSFIYKDMVSGFSSEDGNMYALDWTLWEKWLGMNVSTKSLDKYGVEEALALIIKNMTINGNSSEQICSSQKSLIKSLEEANRGEGRTYTSEEVFSRLGLEPDTKEKEEERMRIIIKVKEENDRLLKEYL